MPPFNVFALCRGVDCSEKTNLSTTMCGSTTRSILGQQPTTGAFGSTSNQSSPFGSSNTFGLQTTSSTFGTSTGVFGQHSGTTAFGNSASAFGASTTPAFGSTMLGQQTTTGTFGSNSNQSSPFGSSTAFGATSSPSIGQSSTPVFGLTSSSPSFLGSTLPAAFGSQSSSAFGSAFSTSSFGLGNSTPAFWSTFEKAQPSAFGIQSTQFGTDNQQGSRVISYASAQKGTENYMSISLMPPYNDKKSHEEIRWEDYQLGNKGGAHVQTQAIPFGQPATTAKNLFSLPVAANASPFEPTNTSIPFSQPAANTSAFGSTNRGDAFGQPAADTSAFGSTNTSSFVYFTLNFGQPTTVHFNM